MNLSMENTLFRFKKMQENEAKKATFSEQKSTLFGAMDENKIVPMGTTRGQRIFDPTGTICIYTNIYIHMGLLITPILLLREGGKKRAAFLRQNHQKKCLTKFLPITPKGPTR